MLSIRLKGLNGDLLNTALRDSGGDWRDAADQCREGG